MEIDKKLTVTCDTAELDKLFSEAAELASKVTDLVNQLSTANTALTEKIAELNAFTIAFDVAITDEAAPAAVDTGESAVTGAAV